MTTGVPRFQELINATKKPRIVNHEIHFNKKNNTIEDIRKLVGSNLVGISLLDLIVDANVILDKTPEPWYESFLMTHDDRPLEYKHCISIKLNIQKIFEFKINLEDIINAIYREFFDEIFCIYSPCGIDQLDVFVDTSSIKLPERVSFVNSENAIQIHLEECVQPALEQIHICGIFGINEIFYIEKNKKWIVETNGINSRNISKQYINYKTLLALPDVDVTQTISNNVWDIYEVLGIEATRSFLINEFLSIMGGINPCHALLLVDRMTFGGSVSSITRYTMKKDDCGPFGRASFEETMDNFIKAALKGESEPTVGVSASIMCGKRAFIGTGLNDIKINMDRLLNFEGSGCS